MSVTVLLFPLLLLLLLLLAISDVFSSATLSATSLLLPLSKLALLLSSSIPLVTMMKFSPFCSLPPFISPSSPNPGVGITSFRGRPLPLFGFCSDNEPGVETTAAEGLLETFFLFGDGDLEGEEAIPDLFLGGLPLLRGCGGCGWSSAAAMGVAGGGGFSGASSSFSLGGVFAVLLLPLVALPMLLVEEGIRLKYVKLLTCCRFECECAKAA